jgi:hypothetical protein
MAYDVSEATRSARLPSRRVTRDAIKLRRYLRRSEARPPACPNLSLSLSLSLSCYGPSRWRFSHKQQSDSATFRGSGIRIALPYFRYSISIYPIFVRAKSFDCKSAAVAMTRARGISRRTPRKNAISRAFAIHVPDTSEERIGRGTGLHNNAATRAKRASERARAHESRLANEHNQSARDASRSSRSFCAAAR